MDDIVAMRATRREVVMASVAIGSIGLTGCLGDDDDDGDDHSHDDHDHDDHDDHDHDDHDDHDHDDHDDHDHDDHDHDDAAFFDDLGVSEFQLLDRAEDPHEEISYMHGDHWHGAGDFPTVPLGDNLSIGAEVEMEDGDPLELGDEYELRADLAEDAADIVSFDSHGDHVHVIGDEEGVTEIVFEIWHDDHADYRTDTLAVTVSENDD